MDIRSVVDRIDQRLAVVGKTAEKASLEAGLSRDGIRNLRRAATETTSGRRRRGGANANTLYALAPVLETNLTWLLHGTGSPECRDLPPEVAELAAIMPDLKADDRGILLALAKRLRADDRADSAPPSE